MPRGSATRATGRVIILHDPFFSHEAAFLRHMAVRGVVGKGERDDNVIQSWAMRDDGPPI
jgi:hypothetical protein